MIISATFIGTDGSLGYRRGQRYRLVVNEDTTRAGRVLEIVSPVKCPYANLSAFLRNWQSLTLVGDP